MDVNNTVYTQEPHPIRSDHEVVPVADLWNAISSSPFYQANETYDLYEELQSALASGKQLFSMPLAPVSEEIGFNDETESNFGIELPGETDLFTLLDDCPLTTSCHVNLNSPVAPDNPTYPWPSKAVPLYYYLMIQFSEAQKKAVLSWTKELGACNVPSLYALNQCQESVQTLVGNPTEKITARLGNIFYLNNVGKAIAKDYVNPLTRLVMQDYPEDGGKEMSQVFNREKMLFERPSPPAAKVNGEIYFVNELLQDASGDYFIPECFFLVLYTSTGDNSDKQLYALGHTVQRTEDEFIVSDEQEIIPTCNFRRSFPEISANDDKLACGLTESSRKYAKLVPNQLRTKSQGCMVYSVPLIVFMDDVSGNISKQWNKHHTIYMSNANLPREMLEKEFCIRFVMSSPHAAPMEMMSAMQESISKATESGVFTWDCKYEEEVMLELYGLFLGGNNPMQAKECSHAGLHCNYFCRTCEVSGTKEYKASDEGYKSIFVPGKLRTPAGTAEEIHAQFASALCSGASEKIKKSVVSSGVKDTTTGSILETVVELGKKLRKWSASIQAKPESEIKAILEKQLEDLLQGSKLEDAINPLLSVEGFNVHQDTPTEILHTVLLGVVKYFWGQSVYLLKKAKVLDVFQMHLDSIEKDGLNAPYIIKHMATGSYWFDNTSKKWVQAGDAVLSYLNEHPEQAWLLGICTREPPATGNVFIEYLPGIVDSKPVLWTATRCAKALKLLQPAHHAQYCHGILLILGNGEKASLEGHVIFHDSATSRSDIGQCHICQERTETACTKFIFQHKPSPFYLLNAYSIHNYAQIQSVISQSLHETPLRVSDAADVRLAAAHQIQEKKVAKNSGETSGTEPASAPPAVFDCLATKAASKSKKTQKAKEKAPQPQANPQQRTIIQAAASSSSHIPTPHTAPATSHSHIPSLSPAPALVPSHL
ncbi:uncharacterized protein EDB93DRAFT_1085956 [Suillus bovinus]|uniref:uncharacterized protein n=1 Tax=Suillus bovinus TaxID=48563 RepID=UPI001B86EA38|nr:uncharacterized protein EDB93DRAFT_1085956 [Suillus bovinus]KAG2146590.1 hypothetical protein EDB93DRAFT_1085956 [Suillus bovinus]